MSAFSNHINFDIWLEDLISLDAKEAWQGAASVWTHAGNIKQYRDQCFKGIEAGLNANRKHREVIVQKMENLFLDSTQVIIIPIELICLFFTTIKSSNENKHHRLNWFGKWLNAVAHCDPELAITATEYYLDYINHIRQYLYDHENNLTQLMTRLFADAEEREESDHGKMLQRVVSIQDQLLSLGLDSINDWLKAAERP